MAWWDDIVNDLDGSGGSNSRDHAGLDTIHSSDPKALAVDFAAALANGKGHYLDILHIPSGESVRFKAFIDDYQDKYDSSWDDVTVYGRMDPIYQFQGTTRVISLDWHVPSISVEESLINHRKCSLLFSMLYPNYEESAVGFSSSTKISTSPIFKVKFGNLIQDPSAGSGGDVSDSGLVGVITGFTYAPDLDLGFIDEGVGNLYPKSVKLALEFKVLHTHGLGWNGKHKRESQFPYGDINAQNRPPSATGSPDRSGTGPGGLTPEQFAALNSFEQSQVLAGEEKNFLEVAFDYWADVIGDILDGD